MNRAFAECGGGGAGSGGGTSGWRRSLRSAWLTAFLLTGAAPLGAAAAPEPAPVHHELTVTLHPERGRLDVEDRITLPEGFPHPGTGLAFTLHRGLSPASRTEGVKIEADPRGRRFPSAAPSETFRALVPPGNRTFAISYGGEIHHPLESEEAEYARGFRETPGLISEAGVFLSESSLWYPHFGEGLVTFRLDVRVPRGWASVSQGARTLDEVRGEARFSRWESPEPQTDIYLLAGRFTEYRRGEGGVEALVFLRAPDPPVADRYLDATGPYLEMYEKLIGPYPYRKFALVENFWETGYGMPSFTLLGSRIIRFPFILTSSYPHEILHNWWGNGVYLAPETGNWAEGLTAYLSDHLFQEQKGEAAAYRQTTLQKYADYAAEGKDFALSRFFGRHSSATEAVGYGKGLMFFHMLRLELGDAAFVEGLREFYRRQKFRRAGFADLERAFGAASGRDLTLLFRQWVERPGAPRLEVRRAAVREAAPGRFRLSALLEQRQPGAAYLLRVPLAVTLEGQKEPVQTTVAMRGRRLKLDLDFATRPLRLDVDPEFDVFRLVHEKELPPALSGAFGAARALALLPSAAPEALRAGYRELARTILGAQGTRVEVRFDSEVSTLPSDRPVWVLGWENRWLPEVDRTLRGYNASLTGGGLRVDQDAFEGRGRSAALIVRSPAGKGLTLAFVGADDPEALPGLGRKLPHYHKWSWLAFEGREPTNTGKGRWRVAHSPMSISFGAGLAAARPWPPRKPLAELPDAGSGRKAVLETIRFLSDPALEGRGFGSRGLEVAADYIADRFREAGLRPGGEEGGYFQSWRDRGGEPEREARLRNVIGLLPGTLPSSEGSVLLGAHYDHLGRGWPDAHSESRGQIHPGADDNASGVAALLEAAKSLAAGGALKEPVVFAAFSGEEAGRRGSRRYVSEMPALPGGRPKAVVNLDTVGRLQGRKLLVLGAGSAKGWGRLAEEAGASAGLEVEVVSGDPGGSDQVSFLEAGIPAVQLFSGPHPDYHRPGDTPDKIDPEGLEKVARFAAALVRALASGTESLGPFTLSSRRVPPDAQHPGGGGRRSRLGAVPDFAYSGLGVRLSGVSPGSPAESAGLREGDVIIGLGSFPVDDLKSFAAALGALPPGHPIGVRFLREGAERRVEARLDAR